MQSLVLKSCVKGGMYGLLGGIILGAVITESINPRSPSIDVEESSGQAGYIYSSGQYF